MPLRALVDGREVQVWDLDRDEWSVLRRRGRTDASTVVMACCGAPGVAKTSRNGNPFFAHRPVGRGPSGAAPPCRWAGESAAHAVCKLLAAAGAQAAGWEVRTEAAAQNGTWRADVLCARGAARVALEIQLARTVPGEIVARQDRYREAGIRGAWFVPTSLCPAPSRELPAFPLEVVGGMARSAPASAQPAHCRSRCGWTRSSPACCAAAPTSRRPMSSGRSVAPCWSRRRTVVAGAKVPSPMLWA